MSLAQRLNELAEANADGLLSDDDYRVLRQSAFEQYAGDLTLPVEAPVVPGRAEWANGLRSASIKSPTLEHTPADLSQVSTEDAYAKPSSPGTVVTNLIRRATGRSSSKHINRPNINTESIPEHPGPLPSPSPSPSPNPKRSRLPRLFHKKPPDLPPLRINAPLKGTSPTSPQQYGSISTPSSILPILTPISAIEDNLVTSKDIRERLASTEAELSRLVDAFNTLETSVTRRMQKERAYRLPVSPPESVNVLIEGREWREHRMTPSHSTPLLDRPTHRRYRLPHGRSADGLYSHSGSTDGTSFSRSLASLTKHIPSSPLSLQFRSSLRRQGSISSSVSSQAAPSFSSNRHALSPENQPSLSASHLSLSVFNSSSGHGSDELAQEATEGTDDGQNNASELQGIQQRRKEVIARYTQRIEYLKAKQKGAELHEKLLRK